MSSKSFFVATLLFFASFLASDTCASPSVQPPPPAPAHHTSLRQQQRRLGYYEACLNSRGDYFQDYSDAQPQCSSCEKGIWEYSYDCQNTCSYCNHDDSQCAQQSFKETWASEYGLVSEYRKGNDYCQRVTRGEYTGRQMCLHLVYERNGDVDFCRLSIDGEDCAWCQYQECAPADGSSEGSYLDAVGDCTNLYPGSTLNHCTGTYKGIFASIGFLYQEETSITIDCDTKISNEITENFGNFESDGTMTKCHVVTSLLSLLLWVVFSFA